MRDNFNLIPELYNTLLKYGRIGDYAGSLPMVGYGAGAYILTAFDRAGKEPPSRCDSLSRDLLH